MGHHVDPPGLIPGRLVGLGPTHRAGDAGIGEEDVDRAAGLARLGDQGAHAALAARVELDGESAHLLGDRPRPLDVAIGGHERPRPLLREAPHERSPDPPAAPVTTTCLLVTSIAPYSM